MSLCTLALAAVAATLLSGASASASPSRVLSEGDAVEILSGLLASARTQLPLDPRVLPFGPEAHTSRRCDVLGALSGGCRPASLGRVVVLEDSMCAPVGPQVEGRTYNRSELSLLAALVGASSLDGVPAASADRSSRSGSSSTSSRGRYTLGVPLGAVVGRSLLLHNHFDLVVHYKDLSSALQHRQVRVTGLEVQPASHDYDTIEDAAFCLPSGPLVVSEAAHKTVYWTYSVAFVKQTPEGPPTAAAFSSISTTECWIAIARTALAIAAFAGITVGFVRSDLRHPRALLAASVAFGLQVFASVAAVMATASLGCALSAPAVLAIASAGSLPAGFLCYALHGLVGGCHWALATAAAESIPLALVAVYGALDCLGLFHWGGTPSALSLAPSSYCLLAFAIVLVLLPVALVGGLLARVCLPGGTESARGPRVFKELPRKPWHAYPLVLPALCGLITFGAIDVQLHYVLASFAGGVAYDNLWGHLCAALALTVLACAVTSVVAVHNQLSAGNGDWWWTGFLTGASSAVFCLGYALCFLWARGGVGTAGGLAVIVYFCAVGAVLMFFAAGAVGFCSSLAFVSALRHAVATQQDITLALEM
eukprot:m51a1_g12669 hypothetical protein (595) ;mRNA; r:993-3243